MLRRMIMVFIVAGGLIMGYVNVAETDGVEINVGSRFLAKIRLLDEWKIVFNMKQKAAFLAADQQYEEALAIIQRIISERWYSSHTEEVNELVASAYLKKIAVLVQLKNYEEALSMADELIYRFAASNEALVNARMAQGYTEKIALMIKLNEPPQTIYSVGDEMLGRYGSGFLPDLFSEKRRTIQFPEVPRLSADAEQRIINAQVAIVQLYQLSLMRRNSDDADLVANHLDRFIKVFAVSNVGEEQNNTQKIQDAQSALYDMAEHFNKGDDVFAQQITAFLIYSYIEELGKSNEVNWQKSLCRRIIQYYGQNTDAYIQNVVQNAVKKLSEK